jgi:serine/threonine-protein kinase RsbW
VTQLAPDETTATHKDDVVVLVVPADGSYLAVLRTATAGLAARLQFTLDEIEDLRIAVDEACAMLLAVTGRATGGSGAGAANTTGTAGGSGTTGSAELTCEFEVTPTALSISVGVSVEGTAVLPGNQSFSWQVLTALAGEVTADASPGRAAIRLTKRRTPR